MSVAPGWYPDESGVVRYWNGAAWGYPAPGAGSAAAQLAVPSPVVPVAPATDAPAAPVESSVERAPDGAESPVSRALSQLIAVNPDAWALQSVRIDGGATVIDHVLVIGRVIFVIDVAQWIASHDYLLQLDAKFEQPAWWTQGQPVDPSHVHDRVLRWGRDEAVGWEEFDESTVRIRGQAERFAREAGLADPQRYQMVPVCIVASSDVTARIDSDQPTWFQFTTLEAFPAAVAAVTAAASEFASGVDQGLRDQLTAHQAGRAQTQQQGSALTAQPVTQQPVQPLTVPQSASQYAVVQQPVHPVQPYAGYQQAPQVEHYGYPVYAQPSAGQRQTNGLAVSGFIVGLVSIFLPLVFGLAAGITGLVLSIVGVNRSKQLGSGKGLGVAGIVLSSVGIIFLL